MEDRFQGMVIRSVFKDHSVGGSRTMNGRNFHGFLIKLQGETEYFDGESILLLSPGDILFVPQYASYAIREVTPGYSCVVNFDGCAGWEKMQKLSVPAGVDAEAFAEKLYRRWQKEDSIYGVLSQLYGLLDKAAAAARTKEYLSPGERQFLQPVMDYLKENLTDPGLQISALAGKAGVSETYLRRIFKKRYGLSPAGYITRERMRQAKNLLESGEEMTIQQVALQVGYRDALYFSRTFRKHFGVSPTEYYRQYIQNIF